MITEKITNTRTMETKKMSNRSESLAVRLDAGSAGIGCVCGHSERQRNSTVSLWN